MAGEKKGDAFEALTFLALSELQYKLNENLHWGPKLNGVSIDSDFVLGDLLSPSHLLLLTSTGQASNSQMKFWRNLSELFQVKRSFKRPPKVFNLVFEVNQKENLQLAMEAIADCDLRVQNTKYGQVLIDLIDNELKTLPKSKEHIAKKLQLKINSDENVRSAFIQFTNAIALLLKNEKPELDNLWRSIKTQDEKQKRTATNTFLRRGVGKLLVLPKEVRELFYKNVLEGKLIDSLPDFVVALEFATKTISGYLVVDNDIKEALLKFGKDDIEYIINKSPSARMLKWIDCLRNLKNIQLQIDYINRHYDDLIDWKGMLLHLKSQHKNPHFNLNKHTIEGSIHTVWMFYFVFDLAKTHFNLKQGFGLSQLGKKAQSFISSSNYPAKHPIWRINTPNYVNRNDAKELPEEVMDAIAKVLSSLLKEIGRESLNASVCKLTSTIIKSNLEQRLLPYPQFEPLQILLKRHLDNSNIKYEIIRAFPSLLGELIGQSQSCATTPFIQANGTLIHWKSAYKSGKAHKTKELAGRAYATRLQFHNGGFTKRNKIDRLILLIDGEFSNKDLDNLYESGWNDIFYAYELEQLIDTLKHNAQ